MAAKLESGFAECQFEQSGARNSSLHTQFGQPESPTRKRQHGAAVRRSLNDWVSSLLPQMFGRILQTPPKQRRRYALIDDRLVLAIVDLVLMPDLAGVNDVG